MIPFEDEPGDLDICVVGIVVFVWCGFFFGI